MDKRKILKRSVELFQNAEYGSDDYELGAFCAWQAMSGAHREVLKQLLFNGPVWDGDIASKAARDDLLELGLAVRCCYRGEQGYAAAAYPAYSIFQRSESQP